MKLEPECVGCLLNQINKTFKEIAPETSSEIILEGLFTEFRFDPL